MHGWIGAEEFDRCATAILRRLQNEPTLTGGLAERLASRHNEVAPRPGLLTSQQWCPGAGRMRSDWIVDAITEPTVCSEADWALWSGDHRGTWYDQHQEFVDHAIWARPRQQVSETGGVGIVQPVSCYVETDDGKRLPQRRGWNATITGSSHVLGGDPKRICDRADPHQAVHVGFPFRPRLAGDDRHCIVWVLWHEAFLECVDSSNGRRSSTRVIYFDRDDEPGFGQWQLSDRNIG